ncbi:tRNA methyltransferase TRMD/TRM10-type domain [Trypanosoma melophagium]|uniref:tRNA methyltransferase TRMD/TRM10-type domain n=1 Tax=Trypanosoma melophagium TaxID=715481 RepID=UPI00351A64C4|nr:tRNA methyltransferase TRMD/TRM10-type domain [Trypanosoma melophagium]
MEEPDRAVYWRAKKAARRARRTEARAARREAQRREWESLDEAQRQERREAAAKFHDCRRAAEAAAHELRLKHLADETIPALVFDLSFAWCMTEADCRSTVSQVKFAYSALRHHNFPLRPVITSLAGPDHTDTLRGLCDFDGFHRYPPTMHDDHWSKLYPPERVVYLTADADVVLERLEPGEVYIVGAFVDHNARKFLTRDAALQHGVRAARLPLQESIEVGNRCKVLTVNHVVEVLCRYAVSGDWKSAFEVLPTRRVNGTRQKRFRVSREEGSGEDEDKYDHFSDNSHDSGDVNDSENTLGGNDIVCYGNNDTTRENHGDANNNDDNKNDIAA